MKLYINLKNCYGICSLEKEFDFSEKNVFSVYASNGIMKTSLAKTFMDLSNGENSKDDIHDNKETTREIKKNNSNLEKNEVFVVKSYDEEYKSDNITITTLLINQELKKKYDNEYHEIEKEKKSFLDIIKTLSGKKATEIESEVCDVFFRGEQNKFFEALKRIKSEVLDEDNSAYQNIKYNELFNDRTNDVIVRQDFVDGIDSYVTKYNELLEKSNFFKKGVFNHTQASDIATQLEKNGFFKAQHSVILYGKEESVKTKGGLEAIINEEKNQILQNKELTKEFDNISKILEKNAQLKNFREYLSTEPQIVSELKNPNRFKAKLWKNYFKKNSQRFEELVEKFENSEQTIKEIKQQAQRESSDWHKVIDKFNKKFFVPFSLEISNQVDVILNENSIPKIEFKFEGKDVEKDKLLKVLSQGEKRSLYILNILFEVEIRRKNGDDCFLIIDDIADSFDYKNKYAIIEYLKEISEVQKFYLIILTHNFDFHRSICSRLDMARNNKLNAVKLPDKSIKITEELYQNGPLSYWRKHLENPVMLFAMIPMARNLFEYSGKTTEYNDITEFLHMKHETQKLTIGKLKDLYVKLFDNEDVEKIKNLNKNYYELLIEKCDEINGAEKLEYKIILSIAIRLKAEKFMISRISNIKKDATDIENNGTFKLFEAYKEQFSTDQSMKILEKVILMTPENIHLNSFMYEPIVDISPDELKKLYQDISALLTKQKLILIMIYLLCKMLGKNLSI